MATGGTRLYRLQLFQESGGSLQLLRELPDWLTATWTQTVNAPSSLELTYPYDADPVSDIAFPHVVKVLDQDGTALDALNISGIGKRRTGAGESVLVVRAQGRLSQLNTEYYASFDTDGADTINTTLTAWIAAQANSNYPALTLGSVDSAIANATLDFTRDSPFTILAGLRAIHKAVGGYYYVTASGALDWKVSMGSSTGQEIRVGKNLPGLEVFEDYTSIRTQVTAYGEGELSSEQDSDNQGTYGVIKEYVGAPSISTQDELDQFATARVDITKLPKKDISCAVLDLSVADGDVDYSHEAIQIGYPVELVDDTIDETLSTQFISVTRDLANPVGVTVDVGELNQEAARGLIDDISDMFDVQEDVAADLPLGLELSDDNPENVGTASPGTDLTASRDDHVHALTEAGLSAVLSDATPTNVAAAAASGTGTKVSRDDHVHGDLADAAPEDLSATAAVGTATKLAREDHVHKGFDATVASGISTANTAGTADYAARRDHTHTIAKATARTLDLAIMEDSGLPVTNNDFGISSNKLYVQLNGTDYCISHIAS